MCCLGEKAWTPEGWRRPAVPPQVTSLNLGTLAIQLSKLERYGSKVTARNRGSYPGQTLVPIRKGFRGFGTQLTRMKVERAIATNNNRTGKVKLLILMNNTAKAIAP
jgi:hypothetical protein